MVAEVLAYRKNLRATLVAKRSVIRKPQGIERDAGSGSAKWCHPYSRKAINRVGQIGSRPVAAADREISAGRRIPVIKIRLSHAWPPVSPMLRFTTSTEILGVRSVLSTGDAIENLGPRQIRRYRFSHVRKVR